MIEVVGDAGAVFAIGGGAAREAPCLVFATTSRLRRCFVRQDEGSARSRIAGTVALGVDLVALQEIFRLTLAASGQTAALSD